VLGELAPELSDPPALLRGHADERHAGSLVTWWRHGGDPA
jgi:hypothetical protein